ncbi:LPS export ABC transporter periplasmic protein LptC [Stappia albiluteola]|nr:LPS export ABC transporter periplasmic protein LptC [Stappia albiluteola]
MDERILTDPYLADPYGSDWSAEDDRRRARARRQAVRHSRFVRLLKFAIPAIGMVILAGMGIAIAVSSYLSGLGLGAVSLTADGLVMDRPELSGHDGERSYRVAATRAIQRISDPRIIDLENIVAELQLDAEQKVAIKAVAGTYQSQQETLELRGGIDVSTSQGHTARFDRLDIDLKGGRIETDDAVSIATPHGTLRAARMRFNQDEGTLSFTDGISMSLRPSSQETRK